MGTSKWSSSANANFRLAAVCCAVTIFLIVGLWSAACRRSVRPVVAPIPDVSTIKPDPDFCRANSALCEQRCAACPEKARCFATGGECPADAAGVRGLFMDQQDLGADIWAPGCHWQYDEGCVTNGKVVWGDTCRDKVMIDEWFERACHVDGGDHYPDWCDTRCKELGLGNGKCVTDVGFCGEGINSAHCECEKGQPARPTPTPTPSPSPSPTVQP